MVIKPYVFFNSLKEVFFCLTLSKVQCLSFEMRKKGFDAGVIKAVSFARVAATYAKFLYSLIVLSRRVLEALI